MITRDLRLICGIYHKLERIERVSMLTFVGKVILTKNVYLDVACTDWGLGTGDNESGSVPKSEPPASRPNARNQAELDTKKRTLYRRLGLFFLGLGGLGIGIPLLPTVPFWILAAILFARSAPRLQQKIYDHPQFGETVRQFVEEQALSRKSKIFAIGGACGGTGLSLWIVQPSFYVIAVVAAIMTGVIVWLATRPTPLTIDGD